jgi:hypothetical protein
VVALRARRDGTAATADDLMAEIDGIDGTLGAILLRRPKRVVSLIDRSTR